MPLHIAFEDFELDEARFELRRRGELVDVQPKALDLLLYLARHRERVVDKSELLDRVWEGVAVTEASLSQALTHARRALDDTPEAQRTIRTVRGKGLRFVADVRHIDGPERPVLRRSAPAPVRPTTEGSELDSTALETAEAGAPRDRAQTHALHLFAALHCESVGEGGASWSLADVDEVHVGRGSQRRSRREAGRDPRVLDVAFPGRLMSRRHARIVRVRADWFVVDEGSRNGTFVNGERTDRRAVGSGDVVECGGTLLWLASEPMDLGGSTDLDSRDGDGGVLVTVTPRVAALSRDLGRIASSEVPVLLLGESGVGKSWVARQLHELSGRSGAFVSIDAATLAQAQASSAPPESWFERAQSGTVVIENLERAPEASVARLSAALESARGVRLVATSTTSFSELERRLPADVLLRLSGYRAELPPLRARPGDLGVLVARLLEARRIAPMEIDTDGALALLRHDWPGNVRELAHRLDAAIALSAGATLRLEHLFPDRPASSPD